VWEYRPRGIIFLKKNYETVGESGVGWDRGWMGQGLDGTEGFYVCSFYERNNFF
jgi:hypothetical protein